MELSNLVTLLKGKKSHNGEYLASCPGHKDKEPSFSFTEKNGTIVFKCFAGCDQKTLFMAIKQKYEEAYGKAEPKKLQEKKSEKITDYVYQDADGVDVFKVERTDFDDGSKTCKMLHYNSGWQYGKGNVSIAPYNYNQWKDSTFVIFVEGEKCAEAAKIFGDEVTCIPGGTQGWKEEYVDYFNGKDVFIIPDNDDVGREFSQKVFSAIIEKSNPHIVELPGLEHKEDIVEWIEKGHDVEEFMALLKKSKSNPMIGIGFEDEFEDIGFIDQIQKTNSQNIIPFGINFLDDAWGGILPTDLVVLSAKSGAGKTQMAMNIARTLLNKDKCIGFFALEAFKKEIGARMIFAIAIDQYVRLKKPNDPFVCFSDWIRGEGEVVEAIRPFVEAAHAQAKRKYAGKFMTHYLQKKFTIEDLEQRYPILAKSCNLIILDHLHYVSRSHNSPHGNEFLGDVMGRLKNLVEEYRVPLLLIAHVRKEDTGERKPVPEAEDLHGSSDIFKIATKVALLGKPLDGGYNTENRKQTTYIRVAKDRLGEIQDWMIGKVMFDVTKQKYDDDYGIVKIFKTSAKKWEEAPISTMPRWFNRHRKASNGLF